jgi:drug/metabolite transporter (DMT)-like permease
MLWVLLATATAVVYALHGAWSKEVSRRAGALTSAWALFAFALPLLALYLALRGVPEVGPRFWPVLAVNCALSVGAFTLFLSALRAGDLGVTYPILALTPAFVIPVEWFVLGEAPGAWGAAGIGMVVTGVYLLHFGERRHGVLGPLAALLRSPGARRALAVALLWSVTGTLDRVAVLEASPAFYGVALFGGLSVLFVPVMFLSSRWRAHGGRAVAAVHPGAPPEAGAGAGPDADVPTLGFRAGLARAGAPRLAVHGFLFALMFILQMEALRLALASYVLSIKRTGALLAVLLGWFAFQEGGVRYRLLGAAVTVAGVSVLVLLG